MTLFRDRPELLPAFRRGDRAALEAVYRHYFSDVSRILRLGFVTGAEAKTRIPALRDDAALRDAIQEVFTRALQERARLSYDGLRPYRPFLLQITRNLRVDQVRSAGRELPLSSLGPDAESDLDIDGVIARNVAVSEAAQADPQRDREWRRLRSQTEAYIATLDEESRHFIGLRFDQERSQADVAQAMGVTRRHVRTLEERVQIGLRRFLNR